MSEFKEIVGKTFVEVTGDVGDDEMLFKTAERVVYKLYHEQDCCESVLVDDINGDLSDLIGTPIISAEESTNLDLPAQGEYDDSFTWTFYKIQTAKGHVVIRWYGTSNGYYSESVDFCKYVDDSPREKGV